MGLFRKDSRGGRYYGQCHVSCPRTAGVPGERQRGPPVVELEHTELFTNGSVPLSELMRQQAVDGPQGLRSISDPEWIAGTESDLFLAALLDDTE
jgi:hypothetical protein